MARRSGFTLIELMVVVGIMILLASIVVSGSFGMSRASGYLAAENIVYNTLQAARQKACTVGKSVAVAFIKHNETDGDADYSLVTIETVGTVIRSDKDTVIYDRCSSLARYAGGTSDDNLTIWNFSTGDVVKGPFQFSESSVKPSDDPPIPWDNGTFTYEAMQITAKGSESFKKGKWRSGDVYGFQIGEMQELPSGFQFKSDNASKILVFEPDGGSYWGTSQADLEGKKKRDTTITIMEEDFPGAAQKAININVKDGAIKVVKKN